MFRKSIILSCVIHASILAVVGWSSLLVAPPDHAGKAITVVLFPSDDALVTEEPPTPEFPVAPVVPSFTPPEPTIEPVTVPMAVMEAVAPVISSVSPASEMPSVAPAKKARPPRVSRSSGRRETSSAKASTMTAGGGSGAGYVPPQFLVHSKPEYPASARAQRFEGVVLLLVAVDAEGRVTSASVRQSCGHLMLDRAALESVQSWRFRPARQGDHAVAATVEVPIRFTFSALGGN